MTQLSAGKCVPCEEGAKPLQGEQLLSYKSKLDQEAPGWEVVDGHHLQKKFQFKNFQLALEFVNRVGAVAEEEGHHPDISLGWGYAEITTFTHAIGGLSENDFVLAAKVSKI
jgi:4a-hydroxytetrahydrobiopterin dehydratase